MAATGRWLWVALPNNIHRAHHFVVFMLKDVAVPDEPTFGREPNPDARYLAWGTEYRVLAACFPIRRHLGRSLRGDVDDVGASQAKYDVRGSARHPVRST